MKVPKALLYLIASILTALGLTLSVVLSDGGGKPFRTVTFGVDRSAKPGVQPKTVTVPPATQDAAAPGDAEGQLVTPTPAIAAKVPGQIDAAGEAAQKIKDTLAPLPVAGAALSVPGCRTMFIHSFSSRHGVRPVQFWLHYTASSNVKGWGDVLSIVHYFTTVQASSHFVIDREGNCAYIVPIEQKAWTQMSANAFGINFEIIDNGHERGYLEPAGYKKLGSVLRYLSRVVHIPLRKGAVAGCSPTRTGIVTHWMGGLCSGGHVDLKPFSIDGEIARLLAASKPKPKPKPAPKPVPRLPAIYRHWCPFWCLEHGV